MEKLTVSIPLVNPFILPLERLQTRSSDLWFFRESQRFYHNCTLAFLARGIGRNTCPSNGKWAAFAVSGAIIAALSGRFIILPEPCPWVDRLEVFAFWEGLWPTVCENFEGLDRSFLACMLATLYPSLDYYHGFDSGIVASPFCKDWGRRWFDPNIESVRLWDFRLKEGGKIFESLPEAVQGSIIKVACYFPIALEISLIYEEALRPRAVQISSLG